MSLEEKLRQSLALEKQQQEREAADEEANTLLLLAVSERGSDAFQRLELLFRARMNKLNALLEADPYHPRFMLWRDDLDHRLALKLSYQGRNIDLEALSLNAEGQRTWDAVTLRSDISGASLPRHLYWALGEGRLGFKLGHGRNVALIDEAQFVEDTLGNFFN